MTAHRWTCRLSEPRASPACVKDVLPLTRSSAGAARVCAVRPARLCGDLAPARWSWSRPSLRSRRIIRLTLRSSRPRPGISARTTLSSGFSSMSTAGTGAFSCRDEGQPRSASGASKSPRAAGSPRNASTMRRKSSPKSAGPAGQRASSRLAAAGGCFFGAGAAAPCVAICSPPFGFGDRRCVQAERPATASSTAEPRCKVLASGHRASGCAKRWSVAVRNLWRNKARTVLSDVRGSVVGAVARRLCSEVREATGPDSSQGLARPPGWGAASHRRCRRGRGIHGCRGAGGRCSRVPRGARTLRSIRTLGSSTRIYREQLTRGGAPPAGVGRDRAVRRAGPERAARAARRAGGRCDGLRRPRAAA